MQAQIKQVEIEDEAQFRIDHTKGIKSEGEVIKVSQEQNFSNKVIDLANQTTNQSTQKTYIFVYSTELDLNTDINIYQNYPYFVKQKQNQKLGQLFYFSIFQNLTQLKIHHNYLNNCEFLGFLNAPCLKNCFIDFNLFTNLKSLLKMNVPSIEFINVAGNPVQQFNFDRLKLPTIIDRLLNESNKINEIKNQDISKFTKLQPQYLDGFRLNWRRIPQSKIRLQLNQRFEKYENEKFIF